MVDSNGIVHGSQWGKGSGTNPCFECCSTQARDRAEPDLAGDESGHCDLICRIVDRGCAAAGPQGLIGQAKPWKPFEIRSLESELSDFGEIEFRRGSNDSVGPTEAVRDRC